MEIAICSPVCNCVLELFDISEPSRFPFAVPVNLASLAPRPRKQPFR